MRLRYGDLKLGLPVGVGKRCRMGDGWQRVVKMRLQLGSYVGNGERAGCRCLDKVRRYGEGALPESVGVERGNEVWRRYGVLPIGEIQVGDVEVCLGCFRV